MFAPERNWHYTRAGVWLRMQDLRGATTICIAPRLAKADAHTRKGGALGTMRKKGAAVGAMSPAHYFSKPGGGGGGGSHTRTESRPPPRDITPAASGSPSASERGAESEMARKWVRLRNPCRLGEPLRCRAGGRIRSGLEVDNVAT